METSEIIISIASIIAGIFLILLGWGVIGGGFTSEEFKRMAEKRRTFWRAGGILLVLFGIVFCLYKEMLIG